MATGVSDRAGLAVLAWRRNLRHHGRRRDHALARRHGALLSAHAACDCGRRRCRFRRPISIPRTNGSPWPRAFCSRRSRATPISMKSRRRWTSLRSRVLDPAPRQTRTSCRSATTWPEWSRPAMDFADALSELRADSPELSAAASFWWTAGGGDFPPLALSCRGLPDPYRYSALLTADLGGTLPR